MKRRITLSIALVVSLVFVSLMNSDSTAKAQQQIRFRADTGVVTLGPDQVLRVVAGFDPGPIDGRFIKFRRIEYAQGICSSSVCKHPISSQNTSPQIMLEAGEVASFDVPNTGFGVRGVILSNSRNVKVTFQIIDVSTGKIVSILDTASDVGNGDPITQN